jgi:hypothetical protein
MSPTLETYAPDDPSTRASLAVLTVLLGAGSLALAVAAHPFSVIVGSGVLGVLLLFVGYSLLRSVARRAAEAPEPEWWGGDTASATASGTGTAVDGEDPVRVLQDRYARGEIGDDEFERRIERLVGTEGASASRPGDGSADRDEEPLDGQSRTDRGTRRDRDPAFDGA